MPALQYWLIAGGLIAIALCILLYLWAFDSSDKPPASKPVTPEPPRPLAPPKDAPRGKQKRLRVEPVVPSANRILPSAGPPGTLFVVEDVEKRYRDADGEYVIATRLNGAPLYLGHEVTALIGPSGVGKSTLLGLLAGLDVPSNGGGRIAFEGRDLPRGESADLRGHRAGNISVVFQSLNLVTHLSALENAALPLLVRGVPRSEALAKAAENLRAVGIDDRQMLRKPAKLSGGQQQRVAVARAFTAETRAVLADEPTGSLDPETADQVMRVFHAMVARTGRPVVIVTHNHELADQYADRIVRLTAGGYEEVKPSRGARTASPPTIIRSPRMGFTNRFRYALSDLWHRRAITAITMLVIGISSAYTLLVGFAGERMYHVQQQSMQQTLLTQVVAAPKDTTREDMRFSDAKLTAIGELPEVAKAFPCVELNAQVSVAGRGDKAELVPLASTVPDDPALAGPGRLAWGKPVSGADKPEAIIGRRLYERLGGNVRADGTPEQDRLTVELSRKVGGRTDKQSPTLTIVGIAARDEAKVFLPLDQVSAFDLWREGKIDTVTTDFRSITADVPATEALVYVPEGDAARFRKSLQAFGFRADSPKDEPERVAALEEFPRRDSDKGGVWLNLDDALPKGVSEDLRRFAGVSLFDYRVGKLGEAAAVVLPATDPRWGPPLIKRDAEFGRVGVRAKGLPEPGLAETYSLREAVPVRGDLLVNEETYNWLAFDSRKAARTYTLVHLPASLAAAELARDKPLLASADPAAGYAFLTPPDDSADPAVEAKTLDRAERDVKAETFNEGAFPVLLTPPERAAEGFKAERTLVIRVVPRGVLELTGARLPAKGAGCVFVARPGTKRDEIPAKVQAGASLFEVVRVIDGPREMVWVSATDDESKPLVGRPNGVSLRGPWDAVVRSVAAGMKRRWSGEKDTSRLPTAFVAVYSGTGDRFRTNPTFTDAKGTAVDFVGVSATLEKYGDVLVAPFADLKRSPRLARGLAEDGVYVRPGTFGVRGRLRAGVGDWPDLPFDYHADLPDGLAVVPEALFRQVAFRAIGAGAIAPASPRTDVRIDDTYTFAAVDRILKERRPETKSLVYGRPTPAVAEYRGFRVTRPAKEEGKPDLTFDRKTLDNLDSILQEFGQQAILPRTVSAIVKDKRTVSCRVGVAGDPRRFSLRLAGGGWIDDREKGPRQVVLGKNLCDELAATIGKDVKDVLGKEIIVRFPFVEGDVTNPEDGLAVPLKVVGQVEERDVFVVPQPLLDSVLLWRARKVEYNEATGAFESPLNRARTAGYLRCNLYAKSTEQVEPLVRKLQGEGYTTVDHLAEQKALMDLARVLVSVVVFFVSGCVVIAGITVWLTTTLNLQSKTWEIGILRSMGVPSGDVIGIFLIQGLLMGGLAYTLALGLFVAIEGPFRDAVAAALAIKEPAFREGRPWDVGLLWLPGVVLAVSLGFSLLGVLLPSARASRLIPAEALRRRE